MSWRSNQLVILTGMVLLYANSSVESHRTMEQVEKAGELMRIACMAKTKATLEEVEGLRIGQFPKNRQIKCYTNCAMEMMQAMRRGKVLIDNAIKQTKLFIPPGNAELTANAFEICRHAGDGIKNGCEVAYALVKCCYKNNPKFYFP